MDFQGYLLLEKMKLEAVHKVLSNVGGDSTAVTSITVYRMIK